MVTLNVVELSVHLGSGFPVSCRSSLGRISIGKCCITILIDIKEIPYHSTYRFPLPSFCQPPSRYLNMEDSLVQPGRNHQHQLLLIPISSIKLRVIMVMGCHQGNDI